MHQNTLFKKPCDFGRGVSQKYSQIIVLFNSKCQNQKQTGSRVQRIGWKQPWITHTLFGGFEYYSAFDWGNYTYKSSTKITSWPNFNHKSQVSIKIIIYCSPDPGMQQPNPKLWILNFHNFFHKQDCCCQKNYDNWFNCSDNSWNFGFVDSELGAASGEQIKIDQTWITNPRLNTSKDRTIYILGTILVVKGLQ